MADAPEDTRAENEPPEGPQEAKPQADKDAEDTIDKETADDSKDEWHRLNSSNVYAMRFQKDQNNLQVVFKGGRMHEYMGVTEDEAEGLKTSSSPGSYVWSHWRR